MAGSPIWTTLRPVQPILMSALLQGAKVKSKPRVVLAPAGLRQGEGYDFLVGHSRN